MLTFVADLGWMVAGHAHLAPDQFVVALIGENDGPIEGYIIERGERAQRQPDREQENVVKAYWLPNQDIEWLVLWRGARPLALRMDVGVRGDLCLYAMTDDFAAVNAVPSGFKFLGSNPATELPTAWDRIRTG